MTDAVVDHAPPSAREGQVRSAFTTILETLCDSCVGAIAAGLVDEEGECVDLAFLPTRDIPAYSIKLCGAHWQIVMREAAAKLGPRCGAVRQIWIQTEQLSFVMGHLFDGYVLLLICRPDSHPAVSWRALRQVEVELYAEAGWPQRDPDGLYWRRAHVLLDPGNIPCALRFVHGFAAHKGGSWDVDVSVLEPLGGLQSFERGFLVQIHGGERLRLVREPSGFWYAGAALPARLRGP